MPDAILTGLDTHPRHPFPFLWADNVELLTLCSMDGQFSRGQLEESAQEGGELQIDNDAEEHAATSSEEADDAVSKRWDDIKARLRQRQASYPVWPFEMDGNVLRRTFDPADAGHRLYAALLVASCLRLCSKTRSAEVTTAFEEISCLLLRQTLPAGWEVRAFGAHQQFAQGYQGKLYEKLQQLAQDVQGKLHKNEDAFDTRNTGDGSIDLAAWLNLGDQRGNIPVILAQCACSPTDWEYKQLQVTGAATESLIRIDHPPAAYCFVPHDLYKSDQHWDRSEHVHRVVLIDRKRLLHLATSGNALDNMPMWSFVQEAADLRYNVNA